jgi:glycosyltransferase involved in cell wall biosynthesis
MPTHNRRHFVPKAIEYFQRQDYFNRELIILDDGTDSVEDLVPKDPRIHYVRQVHKGTIGSKRNLACERARGEIVVHWDDDDWMADWRISYQVQSLLKQQMDITGLDRLIFCSPATGQSWRYAYSKGGTPWVAGGTLCYTKAFWQRNRFADINVGEDTRFVWANCSKKVLALAENTFYVALIHPQNTSSKWTADRRWHPCAIAEIQDLIGDDWPFYAALLSDQRTPASERKPGQFRSRPATGGVRRTAFARRLSMATTAAQNSDGRAPVDIVMLTYNRLKYLQQTVDALFERTDHPFRLTVVDNASKPDVREYLEENRARFHQLILNHKNDYVPAFHLGIEKTTSDIVIATEPDIVVPELSPCWLTQYMNIFNENPRLGLLGMRLDPKDRSPMTPSWAGGVDYAPVYNKRILQGNVGVWMMAIRRRSYPGSFHSEVSVCDAIRRKGYIVGYTKDIFATHLGWYEYRDYPEYLLEKNKRPHPCFPEYAEAKLVDLEKLHKKTRPTIIVTTFNGRLTWLKDLLQSVKAFTPMPFEMVVVDNGTTDGTREFLQTQDWIQTICNEKNLDDTIGVNQALRLATTDYVVKLDTDTLIAGAGWWEAIYEFMSEHQNVGIAGDVWNPGFAVDSKLYKEGWTPQQHGIGGLAHVQGGFMVLRRKMLDQLGLFNELYPHDCMDVELSYRALSYAWELGKLDFVKAQIRNDPPYSSDLKVYHPVRNSPLRELIMKNVRALNPEDKGAGGEILLVEKDACRPHIRHGGRWQVLSDRVFIAGRGWDNCLISEQPFQDCVFNVSVSNFLGSVILKVRLQNKNNPASNSYHLILGEWGNYVAKAEHVFKALMVPITRTLNIQIAAIGSTIKVFVNSGLVAHFQDCDLKRGHVVFGVKDGEATFLNPRIQVH